MKISKLLILVSAMTMTYFGTTTDLSFAPISPAQATTKLGDLSKFKKIALDVDALVSKDDLVAAKARIKDLETTWDEAEAGIKPRAGSDWRQLDKAIDRALDALRESKPNPVACKKAMAELIDTFNHLEK